MLQFQFHISYSKIYLVSVFFGGIKFSMTSQLLKVCLYVTCHAMNVLEKDRTDAFTQEQFGLVQFCPTCHAILELPDANAKLKCTWCGYFEKLPDKEIMVQKSYNLEAEQKKEHARNRS